MELERRKMAHLLTQIPQNSTLSSNPDPVFCFPQEILTEILSRLPVKSLLRFRRVSKAWRALISSPKFAKLHFESSSSRKDYAYHKIISAFLKPHFSLKQCSLQSVLSEAVAEAVEVDFPMERTHNEVGIVGSCNGLVCIEVGDKSLFIWNPTTGKIKEVPDSSVDLEDVDEVEYGFGYDELNDDYKVVGIFFSNDDGFDDDYMVYSLRNDSWRTIEGINGILMDTKGKHFKGKIHWPVSPYGVSGGWEIVTLDLAKEVYGQMGRPDSRETNLENLTLQVVCGYLYVLYEHESSHMDLWIMREYGLTESWTKMVTIPPLDLDVPREMMSWSPLCLDKNGEVLLVFGSDCVYDNAGIVVYDPKNKALRYPEITNFDATLIADAEIYVESLVSPIDNGEAGSEQQQ